MYQSLQKLKKMNPSLIPDLCMYYVYEYKDENDKLCSEDIIPNGSNILVTDINDYIEKRLNFMLSKYRIFVNQIKLGLFEVRFYLFNFKSFSQYLLVVLKSSMLMNSISLSMVNLSLTSPNGSLTQYITENTTTSIK